MFSLIMFTFLKNSARKEVSESSFIAIKFLQKHILYVYNEHVSFWGFYFLLFAETDR